MEPLPQGFLRLDAEPVTLVVHESLEAGARELGLLEPGGMRALFTRSVGASGRAPTAWVDVPGGGGRLVLRSLRRGGALGPLLGDIRSGLARPLRELRVTESLRRAGAPVPRAALVHGERRAGPLWRATFATWLEEQAEDALSFLQGGPSPERVLRAARTAGAAIRRFHDLGGRHRDLHVKNLLVREHGEGCDVVVIDLDGARHGAPPGPARRMTELMRLHRSLIKRGVIEQIGPRGLADAFSAYTAGDRALRAQLRRQLPRERALAKLHTWRYRAP